MKRLKFKVFMRGKYKGGDRCPLYVIRDKRKVLYVGISQDNIWNRWFGGGWSHMRQNIYEEWYGNSAIGSHVAKNIPKSWSWKIELLTMEECLKKCSAMIAQHGWENDQFNLQDVEQLMIRKLSPEMNAVYNKS